jgi:hypothetical protein
MCPNWLDGAQIAARFVRRATFDYAALGRWLSGRASPLVTVPGGAALPHGDAPSPGKVGDEFGPSLALLLPCRLTRAGTPGIAERPTIDGVEAELVVQPCHNLHGLWEIA